MQESDLEPDHYWPVVNVAPRCPRVPASIVCGTGTSVAVLLVLQHIMDFVVLAAGAALLRAGPLKYKNGSVKFNSLL